MSIGEQVMDGRPRPGGRRWGNPPHSSVDGHCPYPPLASRFAGHPVQEPHSPIWVAGREEPAMRRAARYGDGWYPFLYTLRRLQSSGEKKIR